MKISILCIGDELLKGITINTNQAFIGQELLSQGIIAEHSLVVADEVRIVEWVLTPRAVRVGGAKRGPH